MILAITGGTGFVGRTVLDEAMSLGLPIRALTRREQDPREGVEWVRGDLADTQALDRLVRGARAVLHIAGVVNAADAEGFVEGNVRGTQRLVDAAAKAAAENAGAQRFILVSSLAAREPGLSDYGRSKREGERIVEESSALNWTIVRPPAVYGPRDTEILPLFRSARWGIVPMPPAGRTSVIHVRDLARLLLALLPGEQGASSMILEPDDGHAGGWTHTALAKAIGAAMDRRVLAPSVPRPALLAAARLDRRLRGAKAKLTPDRAGYIAHPDWVCSRERSVPGSLWSAQIPTPEGLRQTAAWYREQGWL